MTVADRNWLSNSAAGIPVASVFGARQQRFLVFSADQLTEIGAAEPIKANLRMVALPAK